MNLNISITIAEPIEIHLHGHGPEVQPWAAELLSKMDQILRFERKQEKFDMATQETLDRLNSEVRKNTDAAVAAKLALEGYVATVTDLTAKLQAAIEGGDETAIKAAADAIATNNATLSAAIPTTSAAVAANT